MKKICGMIAGWVVILAMGLALCGCGNDAAWEKWTEGQLAVQKDGQVIYCVVDHFDKSFYDLNELTGMAVEEAAFFNGKNKTGEGVPVTVADVSMPAGDEELVRVTYQFDKAASFAAFTGESLFFETVEEAISAKRLFTGTTLYDDAGSIIMDEENKQKYQQRHIILTDAKTIIHVPYDVLYCSIGVKRLRDGSVDTSDCEGTAVILMKK